MNAPGAGRAAALVLSGILMTQAVPPPGWPDADWRVLDTKVRWAVAQGLDTVLVEVGSGDYEFAYDAPALAARLRGWTRR